MSDEINFYKVATLAMNSFPFTICINIHKSINININYNPIEINSRPRNPSIKNIPDLKITIHPSV